MKYALLLLLIIFASASAALGQTGADGSAEPSSSTESSLTRPTTTEAMPVASSSAPASAATTSRATTTPRPAPALPSTPAIPAIATTSVNEAIIPAAPAVEAAPETGGSNNGAVIGIILGALTLLGAAAAVIKSKRKNANSDQDKDCSECLDLKKLIESKLEEIADLKGQLQGIAEEKLRGEARNALLGTKAGEALGKLERAEENYKRLMELYKTCIPKFLLRIGDKDTAATAVLIKDRALLLGMRNYTEDKWKNISVWTTPGGRCDEGETLEKTLRREIKEETNIGDLNIEDFVGEVPGAKEGDKVHIFLCRTSEDPKLMEPEKFSEWKWVPIAEYMAGEEYKLKNPVAHELISRYLSSRRII